MLYVILVAGMLVCAIRAVRAPRLFSAALWLAGVSALNAILLYLIGAKMLAVIELSLSVGLITILLVFAISMVGADSPDQLAARRFNVPLVSALLLLVIGLTIPLLAPQTSARESSFSTLFWSLRPADVLAQIALIFAGVLGVLGLLAERRSSAVEPSQVAVSEAEAIREDEREVERL